MVWYLKLSDIILLGCKLAFSLVIARNEPKKEKEVILPITIKRPNSSYKISLDPLNGTNNNNVNCM